MHAKIFVAACDVGKGVFAARRFEAGERILRFVGPRTDRSDPIHNSVEGANLLQVGRETYILPRPKGVFVNHSCNPNAGLRGTRSLVALRRIDVGEEIRFDYSTTMDEDFWTMECMCGQPGCRHVIRDFKRLPDAVRERYIALGIVPAFVRNAIVTAGRARGLRSFAILEGDQGLAR
jgi:hypothetical protein